VRRHAGVPEAYGALPKQVGDWWLPRASRRDLPLVVLIHGGYWKPIYDRHLEDVVAAALARRGFAVWNIDYRPAGGAWSDTFTDVAAALDYVPRSAHAGTLDLGRVAVMGHSAGGHLALWLASRAALPPGAVGAGPALVPALAVGQAAVCDLVTGALERLGDGAVQALLGGWPDQFPERYAVASPRALLPVAGVRVVLVHGRDDTVVPVSQSRDYARAAAAAGGPVELHLLDRAEHIEHLRPRAPAMAPVLAALASL
jgi:acetyl esterase/lipase